MLGSLAWRGCSVRGFWVGLGKTGGEKGRERGVSWSCWIEIFANGWETVAVCP